VRLLPKVKAPDMLAVPPTSSVVSVLFPALMAKRDVAPNSRLPEIEALLERSVLPVTLRVEDSVVAPVTPNVPLIVAFPPMEAKPAISILFVNWVEAAEKVQN